MREGRDRKEGEEEREREKEKERERALFFSLALIISFFSSPDKWASLIFSLHHPLNFNSLLSYRVSLPIFFFCILTSRSSFYSSCCPFLTCFLATLWCLSKSVFILKPPNWVPNLRIALLLGKIRHFSAAGE